MSYVLLVIGCAECRGWSSKEGLVEEVLHFESIDEAKEYVNKRTTKVSSWYPHPLGGEFFGYGSGDWWIAPSDLFVKPKDE